MPVLAKRSWRSRVFVVNGPGFAYLRLDAVDGCGEFRRAPRRQVDGHAAGNDAVIQVAVAEQPERKAAASPP
jgi:hypothetical protein